MLTLGPVGVSFFKLHSLELRNRAPEIDDPEKYGLLMPLRGTLHANWNDRKAVPGAGEIYAHDIARLDTLAAGASDADEIFHGATVYVPAGLLSLPPHRVRQLLGQPIPCRQGQPYNLAEGHCFRFRIRLVREGNVVDGSADTAKWRNDNNTKRNCPNFD